jgi:hypothetical protein
MGACSRAADMRTAGVGTEEHGAQDRFANAMQSIY